MFRFFIFTVFVILPSRQYVTAQINLTEYLLMPPMHELEDFERCLYATPENTKATYCYVRSLIKPNASNPVWQVIEKYSSNNRRFYRHDRLTRGICMTRCKKLMNHFDPHTRMQYYVEKFDNETDIERDPNIHTHALVDRAKYQKYAIECVNFQLKKQYALSAQTELDYCITSDRDITTELDMVDLSFIVMCISIITIISLSTLYDFHLKRSNLPHMCNREHYKRPVNEGSFSPLLVSFSLPRNWYKLTSDSGSNTELSRDLRSINAMRCFCMFGVILGHAALAISISPLENTYFIEEKFFNCVNMIMINGTNILQAFFAMSGLLIAVQFMDLREKNKYKSVFFWKAIIYRYLRFTPAYMFMVFFNATMLLKMTSGPVWPHYADNERSHCRRNWWTNILYVNNFIAAREPCVQHAWYLAVDFQLTIIGTLIQMIIWKFTKLTKTVLSLSLLTFWLIPAVITYVDNLDGTFMASPETQRYAHWYDAQYHSTYIPFYGNAHSFIFGMIGGLVYSKHKQGHFDLTKTKLLPIVWYTMIPVAFINLVSGYIFYEFEFEKPAVWIAVYASLSKSIWGIFGTVLVIGIALNTGGIIKNIFRLPMFRSLGRLTFGAYLIHPCILRVSYGHIRKPIFTNDFVVLQSTVSTFVLSYCMSFLLCMAVEMPFSVIQKYLFNRDRHSNDKTIYETTEVEAIKLSKNISDIDAKTNKSFC